MFITFYKEYNHGKDRNNYKTCELSESGAYTADTKEQLLNDMFRAEKRHSKSKGSGHYEYEYTNIEWMGMYEIDIKQTFYQNWEFGIDIENDAICATEAALLEMIANSDKAKEAAAEAAVKRKEQEKKKQADAVIRKQKRIESKARQVERDELKDREDYKRLRLKFEGDK